MQRTPQDIRSLGWNVIHEEHPWILVTAVGEVKTAFHFHDTPAGWYLRKYIGSDLSNDNRCSCPFPPNFKLLLDLIDD